MSRDVNWCIIKIWKCSWRWRTGMTVMGSVCAPITSRDPGPDPTLLSPKTTTPAASLRERICESLVGRWAEDSKPTGQVEGCLLHGACQSCLPGLGPCSFIPTSPSALFQATFQERCKYLLTLLSCQLYAFELSVHAYSLPHHQPLPQLYCPARRCNLVLDGSHSWGIPTALLSGALL